MQAEDRPIHFGVELIHPPKKHERPALQKLYYELSQVRGAAYDSSDFSPPGPPKFYSRRAQKAQSLAVFLPDRMLIVEEWVDKTLSDFITRVDEVARRAMAELDIPAIAVLTCTIRTTFALAQHQDARAFLMEHVCNQAGRIGPHFKRPMAVGGLRFVMPETPDHPGNLHVKIESYRHTTHEVFVEVKGIFPNLHIQPDRLGEVRGHIQAVRTFIDNSVYPYLNQFQSTPEEAP